MSASDNKPIVITFAVVVVVIVLFIGYFVTSSDPEPEVTQEIDIPEEIAPVPVAEPEPEPEPEPETEPEPVALPEPEEPAFVLPTLDDSDVLVRDGVVSLTRHEGINRWLGPDQLTRKFVAFVDNAAHGQIAKEPVRALTPEGPFLATKIDDETFLLDPASYERYNDIADVAASIDARRAAEFYQLIQPLLQSAYQELGYGDKPFEDVVFDAVGRLLETPVVEGDIRLVRPVVMYHFEDESLESLSPAQKQLIRMGPRNQKLVQAKIGELARELRKVLGR